MYLSEIQKRLAIDVCKLVEKPSSIETIPDFPYVSMADFLHGGCEVFAYALNEQLGYKTYIRKNKSCIHYFCRVFVNGYYLYMDVRGSLTEDFF